MKKKKIQIYINGKKKKINNSYSLIDILEDYSLKNKLIASTSLKRKGLADPYRHRKTITGGFLSEVNSAFLIIHGERKYKLLTKAICNGALDLPVNRGLKLLGPKLRIYALDWKNGDI